MALRGKRAETAGVADVTVACESAGSLVLALALKVIRRPRARTRTSRN